MVDKREVVRAALDELPYDHRIAIELAYFQRITQAAIAKTLDTPLGTIKTSARLGMRKLRVALEGKVGLIEPSQPLERSDE